jgi:hypothetical protein
MGIHARQATRFIGRQCRKTCTVTTGPVCYRRRPGAATMVMVMTVRAPGGPPPAMVAAGGIDAPTVADGRARAGRQGQAVHASRVEHPRDLGPVQAEAIRGNKPGGMVWLARAMLVRTRLGLAGAVSAPRDLTRMRRRIERGRRGAAPRPLLVWIDGLHADGRAIRATCRDPVRTGAHGCPRQHSWTNVGIAHGVKRSAPRRVIDVERRRVEGTPARVERLRRRSQGPGVINTAASERLNTTCRARLAALTRRGRALARRLLTRHPGRSLVGTV